MCVVYMYSGPFLLTVRTPYYVPRYNVHEHEWDARPFPDYVTRKTSWQHRLSINEEGASQLALALRKKGSLNTNFNSERNFANVSSSLLQGESSLLP